jgi:serine protease Do
MGRSRRNALAMASVVLVLSASVARGQALTPRPVAAADLSNALETTTGLASPAVVQIFATSYTPGEGLVPRTIDLVTTQRASGSGVVVHPDGYIVTNAHVVGGAQRLRVEIPVPAQGQSILATRSRSVGARIIGIDAETDLALIKVDENNLTTLSFSDSDELRAGQVVLALGSPLGLQNSVSFGVISAVARQLESESPMIYVQTDAPINPGSSGGPLVDVRGRLVGVNTLIVSQTGGNEGLGFAVPSNIVRTVYEQLKAVGYVRRGEIGIRAQTVTPILASGLGLARASGAVIADVLPGSPADGAGLRPGDQVLTLDGKPLENGRQLHVRLYRRLAGDVVTLEVLRDGQSLKVPVTMAERRGSLSGVTASIDPRQNLVPRLGILGVNLDSRIASLLPALRVRTGVVVASTVAGAIDSREGGLAPRDVVSAVNRTPVAGLSDLRAALNALRTGDPVVLQLERRGELMYLAFSVD